MNLRAIRVGLAAVAEPFDFTTYSFLHSNPTPPAVVVGLPDVEYGVSLKLAKVTVSVFVVLSNADDEDRDAVFDAAFSTRVESLVDAYNEATNAAWKSCKVVSAGDYQTVALGATAATAGVIELELLA